MTTAIQVRYRGPTNTKGGRWVASAGGKRVTVGFHSAPVLGSYSYGGSTTAAAELARRLGWTGLWVRGHVESGDAYVFVRVGAPKARLFKALGLMHDDAFMVTNEGAVLFPGANGGAPRKG